MLTDQTTRAISWKDSDGMVHFRDDIPRDAVFMFLGGNCRLCPHATDDDMCCAGRVLAIGSRTVVCSRTEHPRPARIVVFVDDTWRKVQIEESAAARLGEICDIVRRPIDHSIRAAIYGVRRS